MGDKKKKSEPKPKETASPDTKVASPDTKAVTSKGRSWMGLLISMVIKLIILGILGLGAYIAYEKFKPTPASLDLNTAARLQKEYRPSSYEYKITFELKTWDEHQQAARMWGGNLASVISEEEYVIMVKKISEYGSKTQNLPSTKAFNTKFTEYRKRNDDIGMWLGGRFIDESRQSPPVYGVTDYSRTSKYWEWADKTQWGHGANSWIIGKPDGNGHCTYLTMAGRTGKKFLTTKPCSVKMGAIYKTKKS
ncbi:hypothetical protein EXVG_00438 [Emiliania huxleyi virus 202]|nr:hypothetical protein EXVG_00438 [Emiliania huxleyi virus 202]AHA54310.1 putative lectin protein [Emiliania huxleyi virus 18]AHA55359.1 putative lectin protein [Emiliania huxleyi virus 156]